MLQANCTENAHFDNEPPDFLRAMDMQAAPILTGQDFMASYWRFGVGCGVPGAACGVGENSSQVVVWKGLALLALGRYILNTRKIGIVSALMMCNMRNSVTWEITV